MAYEKRVKKYKLFCVLKEKADTKPVQKLSCQRKTVSIAPRALFDQAAVKAEMMKKFEKNARKKEEGFKKNERICKTFEMPSHVKHNVAFALIDL